MGVNSQGSWFPSGYYGHFRSRPRSDFINQYRQQARPSPPHDFVKRIQDRPTQHHFSHHDNRFSFLNTVTSFQDGLGKKKVESQQSSRFVPDFISWIPHKKELQAAGPSVSMYRDTHNASRVGPTQQIIVDSVRSRSAPMPRGRTVSVYAPYIDPNDYDDTPLETSYRYSHSHQQPNPNIITNMNTGFVNGEEVPSQKTNAFLNPRTQSIYDNPRRMTRRSRVASAPSLRSGVASCLIWCDYQEDKSTVENTVNLDMRPNTAMAALPSINSNCLGSTNVKEQPRQESTLNSSFIPRPPSPPQKSSFTETMADVSPQVMAD